MPGLVTNETSQPQLRTVIPWLINDRNGAVVEVSLRCLKDMTNLGPMDCLQN